MLALHSPFAFDAQRSAWPRTPRRSPALLGLIGALHAAAIIAALVYSPARQAMHDSVAFMVSIVNAESRARTPVQRMESSVPLPALRRIEPVVPPLPQIAVPAIADSTAQPVTSRNDSEAPSPTAIARSTVAPALSIPVDPPRFDADYLDNPAPAYPPLSKRLHETGRVMLSVYVESNGLPSRIELQTTSRYERLDHAAIEAVKRWKFVPAKRGESAVAAWVIVPIHFSLKA
jgi:protein TonB